jgi:hypothetical protein
MEVTNILLFLFVGLRELWPPQLFGLARESPRSWSGISLKLTILCIALKLLRPEYYDNILDAYSLRITFYYLTL